MTKWEVGQDLIAIADFISDVEREMKDQHPNVACRLTIIRALVGDLFKENNDHSFTILNTDDLKPGEK